MVRRPKKKNPEAINVAELQPDELNELKRVMREFMTRLTNIDSEIKGLKESRKDLIDEFSEKLDVKMLNTAIKVVEIEANIDRKDTYDTFKDLLKDDYVNELID